MELAANVLFIFGLQFAFSGGQALHFIPRAYTNLFSSSSFMIGLTKALFFCAPCMSSVWGVFFWFLDYEWYLYPFWVVTLAGANVLVNRRLKDG